MREYTDPDPTSKKQFAVDLSSRAKSFALKIDENVGGIFPPWEFSNVREITIERPTDGNSAASHDNDAMEGSKHAAKRQIEAMAGRKHVTSTVLPDAPEPSISPFPGFEKAELPAPSLPEISNVKHLGIGGQDGPASSPRSDQEAISGRERRIETCIVNAAFMASNYPHKAGKRFHKPVVIYMDVPIAHDTDVDYTTEKEDS